MRPYKIKQRGSIKVVKARPAPATKSKRAAAPAPAPPRAQDCLLCPPPLPLPEARHAWPRGPCHEFRTCEILSETGAAETFPVKFT